MEATLRFACLLAGLIAVQAQCPPSWVKVENSCYRAFGQMQTYDMASQACKQFTGCDGISPGHLAAPTSFEERRAVRKLRFDLLRPMRGSTIGEGQRLRPATVWLGFRLGQGLNSSWESTEIYDNALLDQHWGANRPNTPGATQQGRPQIQFNPTRARWNGRCMTLPGQMQMNGAVQKWGHIACNMRAAYICEISAPGTVNPHVNTGGSFNESTGMGPGMPGGGRGGWGQGGQGGTGWGAGGRGQGAGGWGPNNPGQGGAGRWPNNPQRPGAGGWNPNQGAGGGRWTPNQGAGGAGGWPNNPQRPGAGGWNPQNPNPGAGGRWNPNPGAGGGRWNPQNPQRPFNPQQPRMYQQGQALAMP